MGEQVWSTSSGLVGSCAGDPCDAMGCDGAGCSRACRKDAWMLMKPSEIGCSGVSSCNRFGDGFWFWCRG